MERDHPPGNPRVFWVRLCGPVFLNGYLVAVTSYGHTENCRHLGGYQRVDIAVVQDWLDTVL